MATVNYQLPAPEGKKQELPFYLAMEEWVSRRIDVSTDALFAWQVEPTVIFGRNQQIDKEVDVDYCRANGIKVFRRKSGGGCVFADMSNIMFSYVTRSGGDIAEVFARYTGRMVAMLRELGIPAEATGRNDITIGGRKVSGNAFYLTPTGAKIVHGTMLYDTDMSHMARAITPSKSKLESKGVKSVESRITILREHTPMDIDEFKHRAIENLCDVTHTLSTSDLAEIEEIARLYYDPAWIAGRPARMNRRHSRRIEGVGDVALELEVTPEGIIADANLTGDFFPTGDIDELLLKPLIGVEATAEAMKKALEGVNIPSLIPQLNLQQLLSLQCE